MKDYNNPDHRPCRSEYQIVHTTPHKVVIRDVGHDQGKASVTNDVESVVMALYDQGFLKEGVELHYFDSMGRMDAIVHSGGKFVRFDILPNAGWGSWEG